MDLNDKPALRMLVVCRVLNPHERLFQFPLSRPFTEKFTLHLKGLKERSQPGTQQGRRLCPAWS